MCVREIEGIINPSRKPWRTLIRIEELDTTDENHNRVYVVIPAWNPNQVINLSFNYLPDYIGQAINENVKRLYAHVNIGAYNEIDLYFDNWEIP